MLLYPELNHRNRLNCYWIIMYIYIYRWGEHVGMLFSVSQQHGEEFASPSLSVQCKLKVWRPWCKSFPWEVWRTWDRSNTVAHFCQLHSVILLARSFTRGVRCIKAAAKVSGGESSKRWAAKVTKVGRHFDYHFFSARVVFFAHGCFSPRVRYRITAKLICPSLKAPTVW